MGRVQKIHRMDGGYWELPEVAWIEGVSYGYRATARAPRRGEYYWAPSLSEWTRCYLPFASSVPVIEEMWEVRLFSEWRKVYK